MRGILNGIGVGVGDPDMMTLKAIKAITASDYICLPRKNKEECRAYQIAKAAILGIDEKKILGFDFEMVRDKEVLFDRHHSIYDTVKPFLRDGLTVSFLTIGDPTIYSTFSHIAELARKDDIEVRIINGVTSLCACAASLGVSLCDGGTELHVVSDTKNLDDTLRLSGTKVIMKCGRDMPVIREKLIEYIRENSKVGKSVKIYAVANCGTENEKRFIGVESIPDEMPYMTTIIVKEC